jgi:co-chaperonin GroES (HSP10)
VVELTIQRKQEKPETLFKKACGSWCIVRRDYMPEHTKAGILLTAGGRQELKQEVAQGEVICVGDGTHPHGRGGGLVSAPCSGGDRIMWSRYGERVLEEREDGDLVAVPFPEIMGVIC